MPFKVTYTSIYQVGWQIAFIIQLPISPTTSQYKNVDSKKGKYVGINQLLIREAIIYLEKHTDINSLYFETIQNLLFKKPCLQH